MQNRIVAAALVTIEELTLLGPSFTHAYPLRDASCFEDLLAAIDVAEREQNNALTSSDQKVAHSDASSSES